MPIWGITAQQNIAYVRGATATPDITAHRGEADHEVWRGLELRAGDQRKRRVYAQFGWNEGAHESFAYTEVDQTLALGGDYAMKRIGRPNDKFGMTFVTNAIKRDHQWYLAHGGLGFLLGDGRLNYAREDIVEAYYNLPCVEGCVLCAG